MQMQTQQNTYHSDLCDIWTRAMDPRGVGLPESIAGELAAYTGEQTSTVLEKMATGTQDLTALWFERVNDSSNEEEVRRFYDRQFVEAYELANWHSGRTNGVPPMAYPHAAYHGKARGFRTALDFGSGIGTGALCLLQAGMKVDCADIATELLKFVEFRISQRGQSVGIINLNEGMPQGEERYDLITCFDVFEHVLDPYAKLLELEALLSPGGCLITNLMKDSSDPNRPMHVSSAPDWLRWIRNTRLVPEWEYFYYESGMPIQVLTKRPLGKLRNRAAAVVDAIQRRVGAPAV